MKEEVCIISSSSHILKWRHCAWLGQAWSQMKQLAEKAGTQKGATQSSSSGPRDCQSSPCESNQVIFTQVQPAVKTSASGAPLFFGRFLPKAGSEAEPSTHSCGSAAAASPCPHTGDTHCQRPHSLSLRCSSHTSVVFQPVPAAVSPELSAQLLSSLGPRGLVLPFRIWELEPQEHILLFQGCWLPLC